MAPNLINKPTCVRGKSDSLTAVNGVTKITKPSAVRTKFVINNIYAYLLSQECDLIPNIPPCNSSEIKVLEALRNVVDEFRLCYSDTVAELSNSLDISTETVRCVFLGVANELFSEGITWSRVATFFVFAGELAIQSLRRNLPESLVDDILDCFMEFVKENLEKWIFDHGGWEGIVDFSNGHRKNAQAPSLLPTVATNSESSGWAKSVLHGTVRMLGALAGIANSTGSTMLFPIHRS